MIGLIAQITARIEDAGFLAFDTTVDEPADYPYVLLWIGTGGRTSVDLCRSRGYVKDRLGVTLAGTSPTSIRGLAADVLALLDGWTPDPSDGWRWDALRIREGESEPITVDPDTPPLNGRRIQYAVDFYDVSATPLT